MSHVYVGMSGGVDSSLTAALLQEQGYDVTGVYMKNWTQDLPGVRCPWADDLADAKRVAVQLGIDFKVFDFEKEYKHKVVDYMIDEYKRGRTPNPDIMCNQEVKFKLFLEAALGDGADLIATGHYARVEYSQTPSLPPSRRLLSLSIPASSSLIPSKQISPRPTISSETSLSAAELAKPFTQSSGGKGEQTEKNKGILKTATDTNKDQTYFLYRITDEALGRTLFPLGEFTKKQVRAMAKARGLFTAAKKDSQGICFVGKVGIRDFLSQYVTQQPGKIIDKTTGVLLGYHDGAIFYTLGQRHGLDVGGGLPYYVVGKDMDKNEVYVTTNLNDTTLWKKTITLEAVHWINEPPKPGLYTIRIRHRAPLEKAYLTYAHSRIILELVHEQRAIAAGQSVVIYDDERVAGGGIVT